ncbi:DNA-processing protein DprA [Leucobacter luti]|uniref:DNA-processing protein DprA n=1 Tax=Leucobacter luti TaxID=340320 RepID=UPI003D057AD3
MSGQRVAGGIDAALTEGTLRLVDEEARPTLGDSPEQLVELTARAIWSRLIEPGDAIAGALVRSLGVEQALQLLLNDAAPADVHRELQARGAEGLSVRATAHAVERWKPRLNRNDVLNDLERARRSGIRIVAPGLDDWPEALDDLGDHAPMLLWVRGDPSHLRRHALAVVGARACTGYGSNVTAELVDSACGTGTAIVSGAAYGIDAVAHRTALAVGCPTIAVLAGGADRPYPASHTSLLARIAEVGAVCSEMVPGSAPTRWRFLQRNRLIAALAAATLVTEAGVRSGSLNTAGHSAALGRELGAVPGPITSAASAGCHRLIREYGATLVSNAAELREFLGADEFGVLGEGEDRQPELHRRVLDALPLTGSRAEEEAVKLAGVAPADGRGALAELEVLGFVERAEPAAEGEARWRLLKRG